MRGERMGLSGWSGVWACWVLLLASPGAAASSGDWFAEDFESGTLLPGDTPAGRWDDLGATSPNTLTSGAAGAHRGRFGLTLTDRMTQSGAQAAVSVEPGTPLTSEFFVRSWLRPRDVSAPGNLVVVQAVPAQVELRIVLPGPVWELAARNGSSRTYVSLKGARVESERWSLVEFSVRGLGTSSGEARLWVDGVEQGVMSARDWRDAANVVDRLVVGEPWSDTGTFVGSIDFDDTRVSAAPMASRLLLQRAQDPEARAGCLPLAVSLVASASGAAAPSPYEAEVALSLASGAGGFHADAACTSPGARVLLAPGASSRRVYFRPEGPGRTATMTASHPDFLAASLTVDGLEPPPASPDEDTGGPWTVMPGCSSAPGVPGLLPALLALRGRRRPGRRVRG